METKKEPAFSTALALESIPESLQGEDSNELVNYARTIAYKVANNLNNGFSMNVDEDPLNYG